MACLVETPVVSGPPKNQQVITHFYAQETALAKKKLDTSKKQRQEKGLNWYSKLKKLPEELKIIRENVGRQLARKKREDAAD
jgi:hypothetical protein